MLELGGHPLVLREGELQLSRGESPRDTALVLSRMVHAIGIRTGPHETVEELAEHSAVPVINMLTARPPPVPGAGRPADPARALRRGSRGCKLAYVGDGNNVARSLLIAVRGSAGVEVAVGRARPELGAAASVDVASTARRGRRRARTPSTPTCG